MNIKNNRSTKANNKGLAEVTGKIKLILPNAYYRVQIDALSDDILCYLSGKMLKNYIKPCIGDTVKIEMSPTDLTRGRIVHLFK